MDSQTLMPSRGQTATQPGWFIKLVLEGYIILEQRNGDQQVVRKNELVIVNSESWFAEHVVVPTSMLVISCSGDVLHQRVSATRIHNWLLPDPKTPLVGAVYDLVHLMSIHAAHINICSGAQLTDCLLNCVDNIIDNRLAQSYEMQKQRVHQIILANLGDPELDIASIASRAELSVAELNALFVNENTKFMQRVWSFRLEKAMSQLNSRNFNKLTIEAIAWRCGFVSAAHFSRMFKAKYGVSPRDVRNNKFVSI